MLSSPSSTETTTINEKHEENQHGCKEDCTECIEEEEEENIEPYLLMDEVNQCSISQWYPLYDGKTNPHITPKRITILSKLIYLSNDFIEYLKHDGIILPESIDTIQQVPNFDSDSDEEEEKYKKVETKNDQDSNDSEDDDDYKVPEFTNLQMEISNIIEEYEQVFPKMNWSAPKDAQWMLTDSKLLKCQTVSDVFLVLKSSSFITHDVQQAYNNCTDYSPDREVRRVLALRKWYDINPSMEFRCFVKNGKLIGISQRDISNFYSFLLTEKDKYCEKLVGFWEQYIKNSFPLPNYTVDLYISRSGPVFIIDFNVYGPPTSPLLFNSFKKGHLATANYTDSSTTNGEEEFEFRIVESDAGVMRPSFKMYSGMPDDFFSAENAQSLQEFIEKQQKMQK